MRREQVIVSTACPFCDGTIPLLNERGVAGTVVQIADRFAGREVQCHNPRCDRTFSIRRVDLRIRRVSAGNG